MHVTSGSHLWPKIDRKDFMSLVLGPLMIGLSCLPQSLLAGPAEGKTIYQQKCVACHTIGGGRLVGPDLKGVTSNRDSAWLVRWIQHPDKMLAEGDPIATAQLKQYGIPMPALGVSEAQAKDILAYIEAESAGGAAAPEVAVTPEPAAKVVTAPASPENGKNIFAKTCSACHTIGGGTKIGPDLKGVTSRRDITWLLRWIQEPEKMRAEGDSIATQLLKEHKNFPMPNYALSESDANDILGYIAAESGNEAPPVMRSSTTTAAPAAPQQPVNPTPSAGDPVIGRKLFVGEQLLTNGGPACMSCHGNADIPSLGGGSLGPDLTKVHSRMGGDVGLKSVIVSAPFPTMQGIFSKNPVTEEEAINLTAYFAQTKDMTEKALNFKIVGISLGGFVFMYVLLHLIWRNRLTGVRKPLVGR